MKKDKKEEIVENKLQKNNFSSSSDDMEDFDGNPLGRKKKVDEIPFKGIVVEGKNLKRKACS